MSETCPQCGTPRAWEMWRLCPCGHDFGVRNPVPPPPPQEAEDEYETVRWVEPHWIIAFALLFWAVLGICSSFRVLHSVRDVLYGILAVSFWLDPFFWLGTRRRKKVRPAEDDQP